MTGYGVDCLFQSKFHKIKSSDDFLNATTFNFSIGVIKVNPKYTHIWIPLLDSFPVNRCTAAVTVQDICEYDSVIESHFCLYLKICNYSLLSVKHISLNC